MLTAKALEKMSLTAKARRGEGNALTFGDVSGRLCAAVNALIKNNSFLIENNVNERAITHRLAKYVEAEFSSDGVFVDCEYNRMRGADGAQVPKRVYSLVEDSITSPDPNGDTVFPDIIVHGRRGDNSNNILIVEVKKSTNLDVVNQKKDEGKIEAYCDELNYRYGVFLVLSKEPQWKWFCDGVWQDEKLRSFASSR